MITDKIIIPEWKDVVKCNTSVLHICTFSVWLSSPVRHCLKKKPKKPQKIFQEIQGK